MVAASLLWRPRYVGLVTIGVLGAVVGGCYWLIHGGGAAGRGWLVGFALAAALGELLAVDDPDAAPIPASIAVLGAFALLGNDPVATVVVTGVGYAVGAVVGQLTGWTEPHPWNAVGRMLGAWTLPTLVAVGARLAPDVTITARGASDEPLHLVSFVLVSVAIVVGLPIWDAARSVSPLGAPMWPAFIARLRTTWLAGVALAAGAGLTVLVHPRLGSWALALTLLPLLAARSGLLRLADVRRTHDQTLRAMSRLPEYVQAVPEGHAERVAATAVAMGRELGLGPDELAPLQRAALLHEIGVIVDDDDRHAAHASAAVVREVRHLDAVAALIERHRDPQPAGALVGEVRVPLASRILRTACDYDRLIAAIDLPADSWEAVRHFHLTAGHQHEPVLIQALGRTVDRSLYI